MLERSRKIEELQKRLIESESFRIRLNRKLSILREQMQTLNDTFNQERSINDHFRQILRDELTEAKQTLAEIVRRESQVGNLFKYFYFIVLFISNGWLT